jgi:hypothetical protein
MPLVAVSTLLIAVSSTAESQVCLGQAPFSAGPVRAAGSFVRPSRTKVYGGEIGYGTPSTGFASVAFQRKLTDNFDATADLWTGHVGYQITPSATSSIRLCPIASLGRATSTANFAGGHSESSGMAFSLGAAFGGQASTNGIIDLIPSLALEYAGTRLRGTSAFGGVTGRFDAVTRTYGMSTLSVGVLMAQRVTVTPFYSLTFGTGRFATGTGGVTLSLNFGTSKH